MCGIVGWLGPPASIRTLRLDRAVDLLRHRGPDAQMTAVMHAGDIQCELGHTRLAIIDLSAGGAQPMRTDDGRFTLVFNGEIYNFRELRAELKSAGHRFRSRSDTEVLLRALVAWGPSVCARLRGMFAFALFDREEGTLLVARDRLGIKPLYVVRRDGVFAFASEIRALIAAGVARRTLDHSAVAGLLGSGSVPEPRTILRDVQMLPAGHWMCISRDAVQEEPYWEVPSAERRSIETTEEAVEALAAEIREAVGLRLVSDVPLGVFVSGGIDSSVILAIAAERSSVPVCAVTVELDDRRLDESRFARAVAEQYDARQVRVLVSSKRAVASIDRALAAFDQPSSDGLNTFFVSEATRQAGITVALSGLGGDELFGGYPHFRTFRTVMRSRAILERLAPRVANGALAPFGRRGRWAKARELVGAIRSARNVYETLRAMFLPTQVQVLMPSATRTADMADTTRDEQQAEEDPIDAFSRFELSRYLRNTLLRDTDVMSMAHALEVRVPLVDHKVVELALAIPGRLKVRRGQSKPLLSATVPSLPASTVTRPKQGFALPFDAWFRGPLRGWMEERLLGGPAQRIGLLDPAAVENAWRAFSRGDQYVSHARVWTLAVLSDWCERHKVSA